MGTWNGSASFEFGQGSPTNLYQSSDVPSVGASTYSFNPNVNVSAGQQYVAYISVYGDKAANSTTTMPMSKNMITGIDYFVWNNTSDARGNSSWNYFFDSQAAGLGTAQFAATFAAPVPEPEEYTLMLLGFGLVGWEVRQKNRSMA